MTLIVAAPVYKLLAIEKARSPNSRMFLCQVYLEPEGGEPSWAIQHDASNEKQGVELKCEEMALWCAPKDKESLDNQILIKDPHRGLITIPSVMFRD